MFQRFSTHSPENTTAYTNNHCVLKYSTEYNESRISLVKPSYQACYQELSGLLTFDQIHHYGYKSGWAIKLKFHIMTLS